MAIALLALFALLSEDIDAEIKQASKRYRVPESVIRAVIWHESRGDRWAIGWNRNGSCDIGLMQVNVPRCNGRRAVAYLASLRAQLNRGASILRYSRIRCRRPNAPPACSRCVWALYNSNSKSWCRKVMKRVRFYRRLSA